MNKILSGQLGQTISLQSLSDLLDRSKALIAIVSKSLGVRIMDECVTLNDALTIMRYFAANKSDQDALRADQSSKLEDSQSRELELAVALEIVKRERESLSKHVQVLSDQLDRANQRSDRLEEKLYNLTESFAHLVAQRDRLVAQTKMKSKASVKYHKGREVLYLEQPVNLHLLEHVLH